MSTQRIDETNERDILEVMREIEAGRASNSDSVESKNKGATASVESPNPTDLLESLKKKRELMSLLDGYAEAKGIVEKKQELEEAINFLEGLAPTKGGK